MLREQIEKYIPSCEQEVRDKEVILRCMDTFNDLLVRENELCHFTASIWAVNKDRTKILMAYHNLYDSWAWTGGHADGEENLKEVALRELQEETGVKNIKLVTEDILALDVLHVERHIKKGKFVPSHLHLNLTYLIEVDETDELRIKEDENKGVKWFPINQIFDVIKEEGMKKVYSKLIEKSKAYGG